MIQNSFFKILESKVGLLLVGFVLTTIFGTFINERFHQKTWEETQNHELLKRKLDKQEELVKDVSTLISQRSFHLERLGWAVEYHTEKEKNNIDQAKKEKIAKLWDEYYSTVILWNENYKMYHIKLKYLADTNTADMFYISEKEANSANPDTIYGKFVQTHIAMLDLKNCALEGCNQHEKNYKLVSQKLEDLTVSIDKFLFLLYKSLDQNAHKVVTR